MEPAHHKVGLLNLLEIMAAAQTVVSVERDLQLNLTLHTLILLSPAQDLVILW